MDIILFGIQGSGKGTQAKRIAEEFDFRIFEAGKCLRDIVASGTELGKTIASFIDNGRLVPNDIMMAAMKEGVVEIPADRRILFDGIPRFMEQKESFDIMMKELGRTFTCININLSQEIALDRLLGRGKTEGRVDDQTEERIQSRFDWYQEKTIPVLEAYRREGKMKDIDGDAAPDEVYAILQPIVREIIEG